MKQVRQITSVGIIIAVLVAFFYNTLWFWFNNPELSQMQVLIQKWPWMVLLIAVALAVMFLAPEETHPNNGNKAERTSSVINHKL